MPCKILAGRDRMKIRLKVPMRLLPRQLILKLNSRH